MTKAEPNSGLARLLFLIEDLLLDGWSIEKVADWMLENRVALDVMRRAQTSKDRQ